MLSGNAALPDVGSARLEMMNVAQAEPGYLADPFRSPSATPFAVTQFALVERSCLGRPCRLLNHGRRPLLRSTRVHKELWSSAFVAHGRGCLLRRIATDQLI
jgi:hypothetical protein